MLDLGIVRPGSTIRIPFSSFDKDDGSSITMTNYAAADILVYKDGSATERASTSGYTATADFDGKTGKHLAIIDLSDNTTADFWAAGSEYVVAIDAVTVDAVTTGGWIARFRIGYESSILNTTIATLASQTSFTLTTGPAEDNALKGMWAVIHNAASAVQMAWVLISAYTGSTKTVTLAAGATFTVAAKDNISVMFPAPLQPATLGRTLVVDSAGLADANAVKVGPTGSGTAQTAGDIPARLPAALVSGRIDASVGAMAANVLTATAINADAITAAKIADGAIDAATFASGAINAAAIAADAITAAKIADGAIDAATFAAGAIDAASIAPDALGASELAAGAASEIGTAVWAASGRALSDGTITNATFAAGAIDATAIADNAIDAGALATGAITAAKFAAGAIDAAAVAADAIGSAELAAGAAGEIADAIWDEARADHVAAGSFGEGVASVQGNVTGSVASVTGNVGGNVAGSVASVTGNIGGNLTGNVGGNVAGSVGSLGATAKSDVNAEVLDVLATDTHAELAALPSDTPTLLGMIQLLFQSVKYKLTTTKSTGKQEIYKANSSTVLTTSDLADDGDVFSRSKMS